MASTKVVESDADVDRARVTKKQVEVGNLEVILGVGISFLVVMDESVEDLTGDLDNEVKI